MGKSRFIISTCGLHESHSLGCTWNSYREQFLSHSFKFTVHESSCRSTFGIYRRWVNQGVDDENNIFQIHETRSLLNPHCPQNNFNPYLLIQVFTTNILCLGLKLKIKHFIRRMPLQTQATLEYFPCSVCERIPNLLNARTCFHETWCVFHKSVQSLSVYLKAVY
jgi:hypothetical protein